MWIRTKSRNSYLKQLCLGLKLFNYNSHKVYRQSVIAWNEKVKLCDKNPRLRSLQEYDDNFVII